MGRVIKADKMHGVTIQAYEKLAYSKEKDYVLLYTQKDVDSYNQMVRIHYADHELNEPLDVAAKYLSAMNMSTASRMKNQIASAIHHYVSISTTEKKLMLFYPEERIETHFFSPTDNCIPVQFNVNDAEDSGSETETILWIGMDSSGAEVGITCTIEFPKREFKEVK